MVFDEFLARVKRLYASVKAQQEFNLRRLPAKVTQTHHTLTVLQDFSGGLSVEDIANAAHMLIHNIANLHDHLRQWAKNTGKSKAKVKAAFQASQALRLIKDLSNNDKHGYPPGDGGRSGVAPKLTNLRRQMVLTTKPKAGSCVVMTLGPGGIPKTSGDGTACAIITGDVVDKAGSLVGDLFEIEKEAVKAWESLLADFGISPSP